MTRPLWKMRLGAVTAAVLFAAVSIGCDAAEGDHFRVAAEVGYMGAGRFGGRRFILKDTPILLVPVDWNDCVLEAKGGGKGGKVGWKCGKGTCSNPAIAVISKEFPYEAKLDHYRFFKPSGTDVSICPGTNVSMKKSVGGPVYFTYSDAALQHATVTDVLRIKTGKTLGMIKPTVIERVKNRPYVTLKFAKLELSCGCSICRSYQDTHRSSENHVSILPVPTDSRPEVWQFEDNEVSGKRELLPLKEGQADVAWDRGGGLCVSVLPFKHPCTSAAIKSGLKKMLPCTRQTLKDYYDGWLTGDKMPDVKITRVKHPKKMPLTCAAIIVPSKSGTLRKRLFESPMFRFPEEEVALQLKDAVFGKRIKTTSLEEAEFVAL